MHKTYQYTIREEIIALRGSYEVLYRFYGYSVLCPNQYMLAFRLFFVLPDGLKCVVWSFLLLLVVSFQLSFVFGIYVYLEGRKWLKWLYLRFVCSGGSVSFGFGI